MKKPRFCTECDRLVLEFTNSKSKIYDDHYKQAIIEHYENCLICTHLPIVV